MALPPDVPAPRLLWLLDDDWVVLGIEYVEGRAPRRPWRQAELDACLDALELVARVLTPSRPSSTWSPSSTSSPRGRRSGTTWRPPVPTCLTSRRPPPWPRASPTRSAARPSCTPTSATTTPDPA